jgi:hypothetical protein
MDIEKEIKSFWKDNLMRYKEEDLKKFNINGNILNYLTQIGVPFGEKIVMSKYIFEKELKEIHINNSQYIIIANRQFYLNWFIIMEIKSGKIFFLDKKECSYCNENIINFVYFMTCYFKEMSNWDLDNNQSETAEECYGYVRAVYKQCNIIEPEAFLRGSFWVDTLMEQVMERIYDEGIWELVEKNIKNGKFPNYYEAAYQLLCNGTEILYLD